MLASFVLLAAQAATPGPARASSMPAPTPTPTPLPSSEVWRPKTLSDLARERRLAREKAAAASAGTPSTVSPSSRADDGAPHAILRVEEVESNATVIDGVVSVYGKLRNTGRLTACRVRVVMKVYDEGGILLATGDTASDRKTLPPGESATFGAPVRVPDGVGNRGPGAGALSNGAGPVPTYTTLGKVDAAILESSEDCK